jgi:hypothetical protein
VVRVGRSRGMRTLWLLSFRLGVGALMVWIVGLGRGSDAGLGRGGCRRRPIRASWRGNLIGALDNLLQKAFSY